MFQPHLITPFEKSGLSKYFKPFLIGEDAFPVLNNAYVWRGLVKKREGYILLAQIPSMAQIQGLKTYVNPASFSDNLIAFSETKAYFFNSNTGAFVDITFYANPLGSSGAPFSFSNGTDDYFWGSNHASSMWITNNLAADHILFWNGTNGSSGVSGGWSIHRPTINGTTQLNAALIVLPYKGRLVALNTIEGTSNYQNRARWSQVGTPYSSSTTAVTITAISVGSTTTISISDTSGFAVNQPAGFTGIVGTVGNILNQNQFNVTAITPSTSITVSAVTTGSSYTSGGTVQGPGQTSPPAPFQIDIFGWRDDIPGKGGFSDADTSERIVSAAIIKDTLIVFFQRSTWRLTYTGNEILPFIWERLNTQLGSESTYSAVAFDESALTFSRFGWIGADTNDVARIDMNIPDDSFNFQAGNTTLTNLSRVQGIRDFYREFAYWTYQSDFDQSSSPDLIYGYNYRSRTWTTFTPSVAIRTFGTYRTTSELTWQTLTLTPDNEWSSMQGTWAGTIGQNIDFPYIVGGDVNGNVYQMFELYDGQGTDNTTNFNFQIATSRFNPYINEGAACRIGYVDIYVTSTVAGEITFQHFIDDYPPGDLATPGTPAVTRTVPTYKRKAINISGITVGVTTQITTNIPHQLQTGQKVYISNIIGSVGNVLNDEEWVITVVDSLNFTVTPDTLGLVYVSGGLVSSGQLAIGDAFYTRIYLNVTARMHQFVFTLDPVEQLADPVIGSSPFEIQGIVIWTSKAGRIRG